MSKPGKKEKKDRFDLELKLSVLEWQHHILQKRFEIARKMYNSTLSYALKQFSIIKELKNYRKQLHRYREIKRKIGQSASKDLKKQYNKELKSISEILNEIRISFGLSEYGLHTYIKKHQHNYNSHIDSHTSQKIASNVWIAMEKVIFEGKKAHFKKYGTMTTIQGKSNKSGILFRENMISWFGLKIPVTIRKNDLFVEECLTKHKLKNCILQQKVIRGKVTYYVHLILEGIPPVKKRNATGNPRFKKNPGERIGIDVGTSTAAVVSEAEVFLEPFAPKVREFDKEIRRLRRKLDRSQKSCNPNNFNFDGTIKRGIKLTWNQSKNYLKTLNCLKELYRQRTCYVREQHSILTNRILTCGDNVYIEDMNFKELAKRAKEISENGKLQCKKRFGKSIGYFAPGMFIRILKSKLGYIKKDIQKVNNRTFRASQYNHFTNNYKKKKLHQRWVLVDNHLVQRDLYSAFLLMNSEENLINTSRTLCNQKFENFIKLHDQEIYRLKDLKDTLPSSIGV